MTGQHAHNHQGHSHAGHNHGPGGDVQGHVHSGPGNSDAPSLYQWTVHHPYGTEPGRAAVEVSPRRGLVTKWRFVVPADYNSVVSWGIGEPGGGGFETDVKRPVKSGPVSMVGGPTVIWFGGHDVLSSRLSAYIVFDGEPPHYLAFGEADDPGGPPQRLEGVSFAAHEHPQHPGSHGR